MGDTFEYSKLLDIVKTLRSENGCPWDREQTHATLKKPCIEEAAEVVCGINIYDQTGDANNLKEELGDLLFQVVLQAVIAEEEGIFTMEDVCRGIAEKMIRRHPHVFGDEKVPCAEDVPAKWEELKKREHASDEMDVRPYLFAAFDESKELIDAAIERKKRK